MEHGKLKKWNSGKPYGTVWYHMVPCGTIWYHKVPYGTYGSTIGYHMVPYGTSAGVGRDSVGTPRLFLIFDVWKNNYFLISINHTNRQNSSNIEEFWPFDVWKRIPTNFLTFWSKNHWKRTILSRVMILFGFFMVYIEISIYTMDIHGIYRDLYI